MELPLPLLMDGATGTNLLAAGMPPEDCAARWVLEHPRELLQIQTAFVEAGARLLCTPTFYTNSLRLRGFGLENQTGELNAALAALTRQAAGDRALVAGGMAASGCQTEPFGDLPYLELVNVYAHQALLLKQAGVDCILIEAMTSLSEARAAILGARQAGLPLLLALSVAEADRTAAGGDVLASLLCLQELGISAFGLGCSEGPLHMAEILRHIRPYAKLPLLAKPNTSSPPGHPGRSVSLSPRQMAADCRELLEAGATLLGGCCGATPEHIWEMGRMMKAFDFAALSPPEHKDGSLLLADEAGVYYLEEDYTASSPIPCSLDMSEAILQAESQACDALIFHVRDIDDAYFFGLNVYMAEETAVGILADSEEALEMALVHYNGRALIDGRSEVEEKAMCALAKGYGALIR